MNLPLAIFFLIAGILALYFSGDFLVDGAKALGRRFRIDPLIIGLTVVAFGTSAPELAVSVLSALRGNMGISLGNVLGSNIANLALILGLCAFLAPFPVKGRSIHRDIRVLFITYLLFVLLAWNPSGADWSLGGTISRVGGGILLLALTAYILLLGRDAKKGLNVPIEEEPEKEGKEIGPGKTLLYILLGIGGLTLGSEILVQGAVFLAREVFFVSERFIGLSIVAIGTSLPELSTSLVAVFKKQHSISLGNLVGSNIFNILSVVGITSLIQPIEIGQVSYLGDFGTMVGISLLVWLLIISMKRIPKWGGLTLLLLYGGYMFYLLQTSGI